MAGVVLCGICKNVSEPFIRIGSYDIRRCPRCRHSFVHPMPSRSRMDEFYDSEEDEFWNVGGIPLVRRYLENRLLFWDYYERIRYKPLKKALPHFQSDWKVLDVGCSSSLFLATLRDKFGFADVRGLEISKKVRDFVKDTLALEVYGAMDSVPRGSFDLITLYDVIEHATDPEDFLLGLRSRLKRNGHILIQTPNHRSLLRYLLRRHWLWYVPPAHLQYFCPSSLSTLLERCGFQVRSLRTTTPGSYAYFLDHYFRACLGRSPRRTSESIRPAFLSLLKTELVFRNVLFPFLFKLPEILKIDTQCFLVAKTGS